MRRASLFLGTLLAALALAPRAGSAEQRNWGIISRPKGFSSIRVVAAPGLSVFLDDQPAGTTDALRQGLVLEDLPAGTYTLRVEKPGFDPKVVKVTVAEGDTKEVRILGLKPKATPTPVPPGWKPPAGSTPAPAPAPVRAVILERKQVPGGTLVVGVASGVTDVLPLIEGLKSKCACTPRSKR
ncbi:MAG: carboxypeptidase regulatory-like domain-containing protein [Holophagales bacterium]|nr:carboxypeptidase regulatory-like domain-containing protein [Holophagales bacterium]